MLHCTFVQTNSLDKERNNHWDFNFQPLESFSETEGNLILEIKAAVLPFVPCLSGTEETFGADGGVFITKESNLSTVRYNIQQYM